MRPCYQVAATETEAPRRAAAYFQKAKRDVFSRLVVRANGQPSRVEKRMERQRERLDKLRIKEETKHEKRERESPTGAHLT